MKKFILASALVLMGASVAMAQKQGTQALGGSLIYGSDTSLGLGVRYQYDITSNIRIQPEFNYFMEENNLSYWELGADFVYLFPIEQNLYMYPLCGVSFLHTHFNFDDRTKGSLNEGDLTMKIGAGLQYLLTYSIRLVGEPKFQFSSYTQFVFILGVTYCF
ncbi:outer membrane beta-barrel protein [uncultured Bacteroides sp.]|uniref:outer membrane beta-barrel protein n=1 Tax=uncultured Bacteroides sp. TaxID=162156 RepID=UPI00262D5EF9|nr:outer membrane beta-barrel protein [uncultured Bacteroides sp.]